MVFCQGKGLDHCIEVLDTRCCHMYKNFIKLNMWLHFNGFSTLYTGPKPFSFVKMLCNVRVGI